MPVAVRENGADKLLRHGITNTPRSANNKCSALLDHLFTSFMSVWMGGIVMSIS